MNIEIFLAKLYVDEAFRQKFLENPRREAREWGLSKAQVDSLQFLDLPGLRLAVNSFAQKRMKKRARAMP